MRIDPLETWLNTVGRAHRALESRKFLLHMSDTKSRRPEEGSSLEMALDLSERMQAA